MNDIEFYNEYAQDLKRFERVQKILETLQEDLKTAISEAKDNAAIAYTKTFKIVPIQMIRAENLYYDSNRFLSDNDLILKFGLGNSNSSLSERVSAWMNLNWRKKMEILSYNREFVAVSYKDFEIPTIINLEIVTEDGTHLVRNVDYAFQGNKIFFFDHEQNPIFRAKYVFLKNISIDTGFLDNRLKQFMPFEYIDTYSKPQYNAILKAFIKNAILGAQICHIDESLSQYEPEYTSGMAVHVVDFYNATLAQRRQNWFADNEEDKENWEPVLGKYSIFDAIIDLPADYLQDLNIDDDTASRLSYLTRFLNLIRPAHTLIHPTISYRITDNILISNADRVQIAYCVKPDDDAIIEDEFKGIGVAAHEDMLNNDTYYDARFDTLAKPTDSYAGIKRTSFDCGATFDAYQNVPVIPTAEEISLVGTTHPVMYDEVVIHLTNFKR